MLRGWRCHWRLFYIGCSSQGVGDRAGQDLLPWGPFSTWGDLAPQGTFRNVWRCFLLSHLGDWCDPHLESGVPLDSPTIEKDPAPSVKDAEAERPCSRGSVSHYSDLGCHPQAEGIHCRGSWEEL